MAIYLSDTGYFNIEAYDRIVETGNHFVTPLHGNITVEVVEDGPLPAEPLSSGYPVHKDQTVWVGNRDRKSAHLYRLVDATDSRGQRCRTLTDLVKLTVEQICALWIYRCTVETVIRWLNKHLHLDYLIAYSPRGVIMQVTITLIVYGLLVLYNQWLRCVGRSPPICTRPSMSGAGNRPISRLQQSTADRHHQPRSPNCPRGTPEWLRHKNKLTILGTEQNRLCYVYFF